MTNAIPVRAFMAGMILVGLLCIAGAQNAGAVGLSPSSPMIYHDMGSVKVQFEKARGEYHTLIVAYHLEFADPAVQAEIERLDPKIRATLFYALDDHLVAGGKTNPRSLRRVMMKAVAEVLGEGAVSDVLIIQSRLFS